MLTLKHLFWWKTEGNNPLLASNLNRNLLTNAPHAEEPLIKEVTWKLTFSPIQTSSLSPAAAAGRCFGATATCDATVWHTPHSRTTNLWTNECTHANSDLEPLLQADSCSMDTLAPKQTLWTHVNKVFIGIFIITCIWTLRVSICVHIWENSLCK